MSEESEVWCLENVDLFQYICPGKMEDLGEARIREMTLEFRRGEFVYFPDEPARQVYLVHTGRIKVGSYSEGGKEIIKALLQPGELFGEMALAGERQRRDFAVAMDNGTRVCVIGLEDLKSLMYREACFSLKITRMIGMRLQATERRLDALVFNDARTRIVEFLRDLAREEGRKAGDEIIVPNFLTHKDIASLTATSRQTVTSVLNELREQDLIRFDRKRLVVRDPERLV